MKQIFSIIPGSSGSFWILGGASLVLAGVICLFMFIAYSSRNTKRIHGFDECVTARCVFACSASGRECWLTHRGYFCVPSFKKE
jgi:hypothetical protein